MQSSIAQQAEGATAPESAPSQPQPWRALCLLARLHHIAADPDTLAHERGLTASAVVSDPELLGAAKQTAWSIQPPAPPDRRGAAGKLLVS
jgi:subfamily B ATP-binding cassette protein HlyB/CyaB